MTIRIALENKFHRNPSRDYGWVKESAIVTDRLSAGGVMWEKREGSVNREITGRNKLEKLPSFRTLNTYRLICQQSKCLLIDMLCTYND